MPPTSAMQELWDSYRTVIEDLYRNDDKTLKEVMSAMEQNYGFQASKSQYELQFKKWNLRKNLNKNAWKFIHCRLEKRKSEGKESEIYWNNILVPNKKVKKEISRHVLPTLQQGLSSAPSPETPQEISVRTPIAMTTALPSIVLRNLPWFQCIDFVEIQVNKGENELWAGENLLNSPSFQWDFELDFEAMLHGLYDQENPINFGTDETPKTLLSRFAGLTWPSTNGVDVASKIISQLHATFCERYSGELIASIQCILDPFGEHSLTQLLKFAIYFASNNILSTEQADHFLRWLIDSGHRATLNSLLKVKLPTIKAFANNIFPSALKIGDLETIQILVNAGVDLERLCNGSRTPLVHAIISCDNIDIIRILLTGGADVNSRAGSFIALEAAGIFRGNDMVQLLLDYGANVNARSNRETALQRAAQTGNIGLVRILLDAGADINEHEGGGTTALHIAVCENKIEVVRLLVDSGANLCTQPPGGATIFELASAQGTPEMMQLLLSLVPKGLEMTADIERAQLQAAVIEGDVRLVQDFLQRCVDPEMRNSLIWTAVARSRLLLVKLLLDEGANVNDICEDGGSSITLLHEAIFCTQDCYKDYDLAGPDDRIEIIRVLLAAGADVNALADSCFGTGNMTPVQAAAEASNLEIVKLLLDAGADVNAPAIHPNGRTALQAAVQYEKGVGEENFELVQLLLRAGADVNAPAACPYGCTALQAAVVYKTQWENHLELIELLLDAGADVNVLTQHSHDISVVAAAAQVGDLEVMRLLLRKGGNVNAPARCEGGKTPLQEAAVRGNIEMTRLLLSAGANVNAPASCVYGFTALQAAIVSSSNDEKLELVSILLSAGAEVNAPGSSKGSTALQAAAKEGNLKIVQLLLEEGANINAPACRDGGRTALQAAAEKGHSTIVQFLLKEGANVNAPASQSEGRTALQAISTLSYGNFEIVQMLLDAGAEVNAKAARSQGLTALQGAAIRGHIRIAIMLLENGADVNAAAAAEKGRTALEGAAEHGRLDMVQLLLNAGADSDKPKDSRYLRAVKFALSNGQPDTAAFLLACRHK